MTQVSNDGIITADSIVWAGKVLVAERERSGCLGCYFRRDCGCRRPEELQAYACLSTLRSDYRGIIWVGRADG